MMNAITTEKRLAFIEGYKAAQSDKQFSLEQLEEAMDKAYDLGGSKTYYVNRNDDLYTPSFTFEEEREIIQSLSTQQLPKEFVISDKYLTFEENLKHGKYIW